MARCSQNYKNEGVALPQYRRASALQKQALVEDIRKPPLVNVCSLRSQLPITANTVLLRLSGVALIQEVDDHRPRLARIRSREIGHAAKRKSRPGHTIQRKHYSTQSKSSLPPEYQIAHMPHDTFTRRRLHRRVRTQPTTRGNIARFRERRQLATRAGLPERRSRRC